MTTLAQKTQVCNHSIIPLRAHSFDLTAQDIDPLRYAMGARLLKQRGFNREEIAWLFETEVMQMTRSDKSAIQRLKQQSGLTEDSAYMRQVKNKQCAYLKQLKEGYYAQMNQDYDPKALAAI